MLSSCKESPSIKISELVKEWSNKKIIYPDHICFTVFGKDTISQDSIPNSKYSIITYVDSLGCMSCKLQLRKWKAFILEIDSLTKFSVPVYFFLHPRNLDEMFLALKREQFNYPVCIDIDDSLNILNRFPKEMQFQTFLLDEKNRVIAIGNPIHNPKIKNIYYEIVTGKSIVSLKKNRQTEVSFDKKYMDMGTFDWKHEQSIYVYITNTGDELLYLEEVSTSCGCAIVEYPKEPVKPSESVTLKVKYVAEHPGYFNKNLTVYCNAKKSPFQLNLIGTAE